jgi:hypothetical protein
MTTWHENRVARNTLSVHDPGCGKTARWVVVRSIGHTKQKLDESIKSYLPTKIPKWAHVWRPNERKGERGADMLVRPGSGGGRWKCRLESLRH